MIKALSRDHRGSEVLINENNILYAVPSINGETIVYFDKVNFLVLTESFDDYKKRFEPPKTIFSNSTAAEHLPVGSYKDLDSYPEYLPRLPTGYVDKRTTQYKEYIAAQENTK